MADNSEIEALRADQRANADRLREILIAGGDTAGIRKEARRIVHRIESAIKASSVESEKRQRASALAVRLHTDRLITEIRAALDARLAALEPPAPVTTTTI